MRPASGDVLTGRSRKSSTADLSPGPAESTASSSGTAAASPSMMTYFLANESTISNVSSSASGSQVPPSTSHPRRTSISPSDAEDPLLLRRRRLSTKDREDTLTPETPKTISVSAPPFSLSSFLESARDDDPGSDCEKPNCGGLDSEPLTDDEDVERSSNLSFPLSITDTLPPGSPAKPLHRNFSPGPSLPGNSLASTRNTSSKSLVDSLNDGENSPPELRERKMSKAKARMADNQDPTVVESLDDSTLSTQFIMPTIKMPSRRPFTARGEELGRLKILVAGDSGIGKTTLIKSIIQANEDIVHVDPWVYTTPDSSVTSSFYGGKDNTSGSTNTLTEIYGSTKPYPTWWSDFEDSRVLRRRKSMGETVLERNVCFVDTPGYGAGTSYSECIEPVVKYVERQLERITSIIDGNEGDLLSFLTGNGSPQIDVVLYVILHRLKPVDIDFMRKMSGLTNVLPVIAKSDTLTPAQTTELKLSILNGLRNAGIRAFLFGKSADDVARGLPSCPPFATSSAQAPDESMDASLLMSPEYVPPLVTSELDELINYLFDPDHAAWLRHSSTKKFLSWKAKHPALNPTIIRNPPQPPPQPQTASTQLIRSRSPSHPLPPGRHNSLIPVSGTGVGMGNSGTANSFVLARVADHTRREEHMAQLHLAKWATDLQKSIKAEKERYERLSKGDRAIWLTERLGECVIDGSLVPMDKTGKMLVKTSSGETMAVEPIVRFGKGKLVSGGTGRLDRRDPMGWLKLNQQVRRGAYLLVQITGTAGVMGVFAVFVVKYVFGATPAWMQKFGI
ncbi:Septin-7 [Dactylellina cionopaga]|nr:Septin-7 [Dactylellina cionopaga]